MDVTVLEARDRVGGRVWSAEMGGPDRLPVTIERGAEFVLAGYDRFRSYAARYALELVDTQMSYYVRELFEHPHVTPEALTAAGREAARLLAVAAPGTSVADLLAELSVPDDVRASLQARIEISSAAAADEVHASVLEHVASFEPLPSWRLAGGNGRLPAAMHDALGRCVHLSAPVMAIRDHGDRVTVHTADGETIVDAAVVALPLGVLHACLVEMALPRWKIDAVAAVVQGHAAKLHLALDEVPAASAVLSVDKRFWTWTAADATGTVAPVLNCFAGSAVATAALEVVAGPGRWSSLVRSVRPDLAITAGEPVLTHWSADPYALGAYSAPGSAWTAASDELVAAPVGRLYFAGEHTAGRMSGLMEGAVRSGERAAEQVLTSRQPARGAPRR